MVPTVLLSTLLLVPSLAGIEWTGDFDAARERAKGEGRVMFLALGMDDEARCEEFVRHTYKDKAIIELTRRTVNLAASPTSHREGNAKCPRFAGITCADHCRLDWQFREEVVARNARDVCAVPQHIWLDPEGNVLLSVPYEVDVDEMTWCFVTALRRAEPDAVVALPESARPPRRLVMGGFYSPGIGERRGRGLTADELVQQIKQLKSSILGGARIEPMLELLFTDEKEAVAYAEVEIGSGIAGWVEGTLLTRSIHAVGSVSPASFWSVLSDHAKSRNDDVRNEVAVAFEQMGSPLGLKTVKSALTREKSDAVRKNWLRALGACARDDRSARATLLKTVDGDDGTLRRNALLALGHLSPNADVRTCLAAWLTCGEPRDELAAACAMGLSRDAHYVPELEDAIAAGEEEKQHTQDLQRILKVLLLEENLHTIQELIRRVGADEIERERVFFR